MSLHASRWLAWLAAPMIALPLALTHPDEEPAHPADGSVDMGHESFSTRHVTVPVGGSVLLRNDSAWLHVVVPGTDARTVPQDGLPPLGAPGGHVAESGDVWALGPFPRPGHFRLTCSLHPEMNLTVDVVDRPGTR
jgi:plastocyanin